MVNQQSSDCSQNGCLVHQWEPDASLRRGIWVLTAGLTLGR